MIEIWTFGFKYGLPPCNVIFDVTFLPNPARSEGKRLDDELDDDMMALIRSMNAAVELTQRIADIVSTYIASSMETRVALGCSSGRHRSRAVAVMLHEELLGRGIPSVIIHREDLRLSASK